MTPRKTQGSGPLHTSFCNWASKTPKSPDTVLVTRQPGWSALTFCNSSLEKIRYDCWAVMLYVPALTSRSSVNLSPTLTVPPLGGLPASGEKYWYAPQPPGVL